MKNMLKAIGIGLLVLLLSIINLFDIGQTTVPTEQTWIVLEAIGFTVVYILWYLFQIKDKIEKILDKKEKKS